MSWAVSLGSVWGGGGGGGGGQEAIHVVVGVQPPMPAHPWHLPWAQRFWSTNSVTRSLSLNFTFLLSSSTSSSQPSPLPCVAQEQKALLCQFHNTLTHPLTWQLPALRVGFGPESAPALSLTGCTSFSLSGKEAGLGGRGSPSGGTELMSIQNSDCRNIVQQSTKDMLVKRVKDSTSSDYFIATMDSICTVHMCWLWQRELCRHTLTKRLSAQFRCNLSHKDPQSVEQIFAWD